MALTGSEKEALQKVILNAYNDFEFKMFLDHKLNKNLDHISLGGNFVEMVYDAIGKAEREGWTEKMIHAIHDDRPENQMVKSFTNQSLKYRGSNLALEKVIHRTNGFIDVSGWRSKLARIERQICSIEIGGEHAGTGFLIAHDLIMTNFHVVNALLGSSPRNRPEQVRLRFDFRKSADGNVANDGIRYELATNDWIFDYSPYSLKTDGKQTSELPTSDELDYAILRAAPRQMEDGRTVTPGNEPVLGSPDDSRGWLALPFERYPFVADYPLFIVQHPKGRPLKMALDTDGIQQINGNDTRFRYSTNTEPGSSGSPCFNSDWNLIGLHHMGDPISSLPQWNQGIPMYTIRQRLQRIGKLDAVLGNASASGGSGSGSSDGLLDDDSDNLDDLLG